MSIVSFAQNFEDVMLWRALKHVANGFYIDIGAQDPVVDSVSKAFYDHGWRGCHIEPTNQYSKMLKEARPNETVLQVAVGRGKSNITFFEIENTGLSTSDNSIALEHEARGFSLSQTIIPLISLDTLLDKFDDRDIHWLKIDVEGAEKSVLESWQKSAVRPWVLVIESTKPSQQEECYEDWEPLVLAKGYEFVYFDGLNRFYVAVEHPELIPAFRVPPNIFDGFMLSGVASQPFYHHCKAVSERIAQEFERKANEFKSRAEEAEQKLAAIYHSRSWRLTAPLRWVIKNSRSFSRNIVTWRTISFPFSFNHRKIHERLKHKARIGLLHLRNWVFLRPRVKKYILSILQYFPRIKTRLKHLHQSNQFYTENCPSLAHTHIKLQHLSAHGQKIYANLRTEMEKKHNGSDSCA